MTRPRNERVLPVIAETFVDLEDLDLPGTEVPLQDSRARYVEEGLLGAGGLGEVVEAHDQDLRRNVALKRPHGEVPSGAAVQALIREAQVTAQLVHPNIPPVYEVGMDEADRPFFTMARLHGETLQEALVSPLARDEALEDWPISRRMRVFATLCWAVAYAHARGVLHRDLKPDNVMIGRFGEVHLLDWGIARITGHADLPEVTTSSPVHTRAGAVKGTPGYAAPEQLRGEDIDERADIYALGALLAAMLTGHPPVRASTLEEAIEALEEEAEVELPTDKHLASIVLRACARDPEERYDTAAALAEDVERWLNGLRPRARTDEAHLEEIKRYYKGVVRVRRAHLEVLVVGAFLIGLGATVFVGLRAWYALLAVLVGGILLNLTVYVVEKNQRQRSSAMAEALGTDAPEDNDAMDLTLRVMAKLNVAGVFFLFLAYALFGWFTS